MQTSSPRDLAVLVLEDDDGIRHALLDALSLEGFMPHGAVGIEEALDIVKAGEIDAVLVDLRLANGELGGDFIRSLADDTTSPAMIILSASTELAEPLVIEFNLSWIRKPFDIDAVVAGIRAASAACSRPRRSTPVV
jgi:DNA-binding response OmpR family regulator